MSVYDSDFYTNSEGYVPQDLVSTSSFMWYWRPVNASNIEPTIIPSMASTKRIRCAYCETPTKEDKVNCPQCGAPYLILDDD
jgi:uncharacterized Zn-finger protein